jgi:hypothetical protein
MRFWRRVMRELLRYETGNINVSSLVRNLSAHATQGGISQGAGRNGDCARIDKMRIAVGSPVDGEGEELCLMLC